MINRMFDDERMVINTPEERTYLLAQLKLLKRLYGDLSIEIAYQQSMEYLDAITYLRSFQTRLIQVYRRKAKDLKRYADILKRIDDLNNPTI